MKTALKFETPVGTFRSWKEAIEACESRRIDPDVIRPMKAN